MVFYSVSTRTAVLVELTCPAEENIDIRHEEKLGKYETLIPECWQMGWKVRVYAVEVGARGYVAPSTRSYFAQLGLKNSSVRKLCKEASDVVLRWSFWIWIGKEKMEWFAQRSEKEGLACETVSAASEVFTDCVGKAHAEAVETVSDIEEPGGVSESIDFQVEVLRRKANRSQSGVKNIGNSCMAYYIYYVYSRP